MAKLGRPRKADKKIKVNTHVPPRLYAQIAAESRAYDSVASLLRELIEEGWDIYCSISRDEWDARIKHRRGQPNGTTPPSSRHRSLARPGG